MKLSHLKEISEQLNLGTTTSVELTQQSIEKAKKSNLNELITIIDSSIEEAKKSDELRAKLKKEGKKIPSLLGIPLVHKDLFCTKGIKTTCGSKILENFVAPYDAFIVEKLKNAGMVCIGKANMDEFAMGSSGENSAFGLTKNPTNQDYITGGSSSGSAAAVASDLVLASTGSDTGGSVRQPASFCGISGIKPTYGRCSRYGMVAFASSLDQAGLFANSAYDLALLLENMAGFDYRDSTSVDLEVESYSEKLLSTSIKGLKIGLPKEYFANLDKNINDSIQSALEEYKSMGAEIVDVSLPHSSYAISSYYVIALAEASSNLSRYDGIRYGLRKNAEKIDDLYQLTRQYGFGDEVKRRIMLGTFVLSSGFYDAYYLKAAKLRRLIHHDFTEAFKKVDCIIGPTSPFTAFKIGEKVNNPVEMYLSDIYTVSVNLAGLPAVSIPVKKVNNLPVGMQIITPAFTESKLLSIAHQFQKKQKEGEVI